MSTDGTSSRRGVLKSTGGLVGVGVLGMLAGCGDGGGGDGGDGGEDGTPTETEGDDLEAVSIGGTEEPGNGTETAETTETAGSTETAASRRRPVGTGE